MRPFISTVLLAGLFLASSDLAEASHGCRRGGWGGFHFSFRPSYYRSFGYSFGNSCFSYYPSVYYSYSSCYSPWTDYGCGWSPYRASYWGYDPYCGVSTVTPYYAQVAPLVQTPRLFAADDLNRAFAPRPEDDEAGVGDEVRDDDRPLVRKSNPATLKRAQRYVEYGDTLFGKQRFREALQRYKAASAIAPDLVEARFRQGHALVAGGQYALAAVAFKRALALDPDLDREGFRLDELYQGGLLAKTAHIEQLSRAALDNPEDADLMFLVGVFLRYNGEGDRAQPFFARASELLLGPDREHLAGFLAPSESHPDPERERDDRIVKVASKLEI